MKKYIIYLALFSLIFSGISCSRRITTYDHLLEPRIIFKDARQVITCEQQGTPEQIFKAAMGPLFKIYFQLRKTNKSMPMKVVPLGRWPLPADTPIEQWYGILALPVPDVVTALPKEALITKPAVGLQTWYGAEFAEILHEGSYDSETPTVERLLDYIAGQGYIVTGIHEEEYVKGPGMIFKGNPDNYQTIIRYEVGVK